MISNSPVHHPPVSRRVFLQGNSLLLLAAGAGVVGPASAQDAAKRVVRLGLVTDLHYADKPPAGTRHYRETLDKLAEAAEAFAKEPPEVMVELGDLIDAADSVDVEKGYLNRIFKDFSALPGRKYGVLGNHCVTTLTKEEFLDGIEQEKSYYAFDAGGIRFIVLDSCFRADGQPYGRNNFRWTDANIPATQVEWLKGELKDAKGKVIVLAHQRLDVRNDHGVKNNAEVRKALEESGKVLAVFQGHSHQNDYKLISGIHYCTLAAMIEGSGKENSGYSTLDIFDNNTLKLDGFRKQKDYQW